MTMLIAAATGNFLTAGTWKKASAQGVVDVEDPSKIIVLSNVQLSSGTFVPAATAIDAVLLKVAGVAPTDTPTGTVTIELYNNTTSSVAKTLTVNATDLPQCGWVCFAFGSTHTPNGTDAYKIRAVRSVATSGSNILYFYTSTNNDFTDAARYLRTTTTQAPTDTDQLIMTGELTGAGTGNSFTLTMDRTSANTDTYGSTGGIVNVSIGKRCTLTWQNSASTNYLFRWKGYLRIFDGGTINVGTSGSRIQSTSNAILETNGGSSDSGIIVANGGVLNMYGATKAVIKTKLTANKIAGNTVIALVSTSGFLTGDTLAFASTGYAGGEAEVKDILSVDSGVQVTLSAGLTNPHSGTSPTDGEVINLTRNVKFRGVDASHVGFIAFDEPFGYPQSGGRGPSGTIDYVEFLNAGNYSDQDKAGLSFGTLADTVTVTHSSFRGSGCGISFPGGGGIGSPAVIFSNNVAYDIRGVTLGTNLNAPITIDGNWIIKAGDCCFDGRSGGLPSGAIFTNNVATDTVNTFGAGIALGDFSISFIGMSPVWPGELNRCTIDGNTSHSNAGRGMIVSGGNMPSQAKISNTTLWRNSWAGLWMRQITNVFFDTITAFGNDTANVYLDGVGEIRILNLTSNGDTVHSTAVGVYIGNIGGPWGGFSLVNGNIYVDSSTFSVVAGIKTAHSYDIYQLNSYAPVYIRNSLTGVAGSGVVLQYQSGPGSFMAQQRGGTTAGNHRTDFVTSSGQTYIQADSTVYNTAPPSLKLVHAIPNIKMDTAGGRMGYGMTFNVLSGNTVTVGVYVRKAATYSGGQPRLILKANPALGVDRDTVLATMTAGVSTWEQLSGSTPAATDDGVFECVVDCDPGTINVDDWSG